MNLLVTLIFLLSSGAPAKDAYVSCSGLLMFAAGDDTRAPIAASYLLLDRRGAAVMEVPAKTIFCHATHEGQEWWGDIELTAKQKVYRMTLKEVANGPAK